jgi:hypothetical protein
MFQNDVLSTQNFELKKACLGWSVERFYCPPTTLYPTHLLGSRRVATSSGCLKTGPRWPWNPAMRMFS